MESNQVDCEDAQPVEKFQDENKSTPPNVNGNDADKSKEEEVATAGQDTTDMGSSHSKAQGTEAEKIVEGAKVENGVNLERSKQADASRESSSSPQLKDEAETCRSVDESDELQTDSQKEEAEETAPAESEVVQDSKKDDHQSQNCPREKLAPIPTPVFEDITDDDDDDSDGEANNIELELDDLIDPADLSKGSDGADTSEVDLEQGDGSEKSKQGDGSEKSEQGDGSEKSEPGDCSEKPEDPCKPDDAYTGLKLPEPTKAASTHIRKQKVTARKSGRPIQHSEMATLKTINLHPIKDITMKLSDVEDALYLPHAEKSEGQVEESMESSSTENSSGINDGKQSMGGRKKRRKKTYDLPGCKKKAKKIRSDAESLGSSADSLSFAENVSLSDGDFQDADSYRDMPNLSEDTDSPNLEPSSAPSVGEKVESALDILTKNSHLSFLKKPTKSPSVSVLTSSKNAKPSTMPAKNQGKIKSVLDMLHRRSQQKVESSGANTDADSVPTEETNVTKNNPIGGAGTTTTTICFTSSESSTTTTIMVSPNRPIVEGVKRKGTPRKRKEEDVICLSDSDDGNEKANYSTAGKRKRDVTSSSSANSLPKLSPTSVSGAPAPVVMVVAQHSTAAGMRSLLPHSAALLQTSGGVVMQGGKARSATAGGTSLLPLIPGLPVGAKAVNLPGLPAGMTAVPISSLPGVAGPGGQQTVTLLGPITAPLPGPPGAIPALGTNFVNISGSKHLVYAPPTQAQAGGKGVINKNSTSLLTSPTLTSSLQPQQLLFAPPSQKQSTASSKPSSTSIPSTANLESLRALLVGKPVALNSVGLSAASLASSSSSSASSILSSTPMLFQMVTTSGSNLLPISAQPLNLIAGSPQQHKSAHHQSLLKPSSGSLFSNSINGGNSFLHGKSHVPNGFSCLTPPKTPETDSSSEVAAAATLSRLVSSQAETSEVIPLCCCKINGASFNKLSTGVTYCQALDTVDNKILGCFNKVSNSVLVRPGVKIPFMAVCESHRKRLKLHQCCPGCGHFCTQGSFQQCRKDDKESVHTFHKQCMFYRGGKYLCPHCGEECKQGLVELRLDEGGLLLEEVDSSSTAKRDVPVRKTARMSGKGLKKTKISEEVTENLALPNGKAIDLGAIPIGPELQALKRLCKCAIEDRPKKYRTLAKDLYTPAYQGDMEKVFYLLVDGMDPNTRYEDSEGQTAIHAAATSGSLVTVMLLQKFGAEIHSQDKSLRTPLMCAAESGSLEVFKFLDKAGAKVEDRGEDGMTSLHYAAKCGHIDIIRYILTSQRLDINIEDDGGWTPIIWATESQLLDVVKFLVKHGADPNKKDNEENTGLHWASFSGSLEISEVFLDMGCELDSPNEHGDRPLHIAARQGHYDIVVLLLARGANVDLKNNKEETPVESCVNKDGQVHMALRVNQQLRGFASRKFIQPERLLERDVTMGREKNPIACVNAEDDEPCPTDYLYVTQNVETSWLNINCIITSLQSCRCTDDCSSMYCVCGRSSIKCWYDQMGRLTEEVNLLEPPLVFECNRACRCQINCNNRVVQNGITCRLQMFKTNGRGWGVRTLMDIPKGTFVCEYIGELISDSEADIREDDSYLFDLDNKDGDTYCIDARKYGNVSRFINHLCEPNLVPVKVFVEHQDLRFPRICLFSSKDISAYEELGFDYGEKFWMIKWKFFTCACKSSKCKYSSETIKKTLEDYKLRYPDEQVD